MRTCFSALCLLAITFFICACNKTVHPVEWGFGPGAITLDITADEKLNYYYDRSHPLHVCVYQFDDVTSFTKLTKCKEDLQKLKNYRCEVSDALMVDRLDILPGKKLENIKYDRAKGAKVVAIAAAYFKFFQKDRTTKWVSIPTIREKKWFFKGKEIPGHLHINVIFGPLQIETFERK